MPSTILTQAELKTLMDYDPVTGIFVRKIHRNHNAKIGDIVGCLDHRGYISTTINKQYYSIHRLAFLYMTGSFPKEHVDHINHDRSDNRWDNLREANIPLNGKNQKKHVTNTSGCPGVYWHAKNSAWTAVIIVNNKRKYLGITKDFFEAVCLRKSAEQRYNFHPNHGT